MTTAGRPTFNPARGFANRVSAPSKQYSSRDQPGHTKLKLRQPGQNTVDEIKKRDLKVELEEKESKSAQKTQKRETTEELLLLREVEEEKAVKSNKNIDADDSDQSSSEESESESDEEGSDDDTEELMKELERIKKEREEEALKNQEQESMIRNAEKEQQVLFGNPLLKGTADFSVKKRWYDDSVFKNQARGETKQQKRFINDTIRNDFHKKFLYKYIQ